MPDISHLVFDLDGTLIDSRRDLVSAVRRMLASLGHPDRDPDEIVGFIGRGAPFLVAQSLPAGARDPASVEAAVAVFRRHYLAHLTDETRPFPGVPEVLARLAGRARLAVLTNKPGDAARRLCEALDLGRHLDLVLGAGDVPALKPDPAGLAAAWARLGCPPEEGWYVGDLALDVETARKVGCRAAAVTWGMGPVDELAAAGPDRLLDAVADLESLV